MVVASKRPKAARDAACRRALVFRLWGFKFPASMLLGIVNDSLKQKTVLRC